MKRSTGYVLNIALCFIAGVLIPHIPRQGARAGRLEVPIHHPATTLPGGETGLDGIGLGTVEEMTAMSGVTDLISTDLSSWVAALATIGLLFATVILAIYTARLARAASQPQVVATLDQNRWGWEYLDLAIENTGNATAFDIRVDFKPPLPGAASPQLSDRQALQHISVLRPRQRLTHFQCKSEDAWKHTYRVTVSWLRSPRTKTREELSYTINVAGLGDMSRLGPESPEVKIADEIKKIRDDWMPVAKGNRRLKIDVSGTGDGATTRK